MITQSTMNIYSLVIMSTQSNRFMNRFMNVERISLSVRPWHSANNTAHSAIKSEQRQDNTALHMCCSMLTTGVIARDLAAVRELEEAALKARRRHGQTEEIQEANQRTRDEEVWSQAQDTGSVQWFKERPYLLVSLIFCEIVTKQHR